MDGTIGGATWGELRRFIVNTILTDPGAFPKASKNASTLPASPSDGDVPIWDQASNSWKTSSEHPVSLTELAATVFQASQGTTGQPLVKVGRTTTTSNGSGQITVTYTSAFPTSTDYVLALTIAGSHALTMRTVSMAAANFVMGFFTTAGGADVSQAQDFCWLAIGH